MIWRDGSKPGAKADSVAAKSRLISQFHFDASREALRACFLANGAALLALLAYLGNIAKSGPTVLPKAMGIATLAFGFGLVLAVFAHLFMWQHQEEVDFGKRWTVQNPHIRCILFWSAICLMVGVFAAAWAAAFPVEP